MLSYADECSNVDLGTEHNQQTPDGFAQLGYAAVQHTLTYQGGVRLETWRLKGVY